MLSRRFKKYLISVFFLVYVFVLSVVACYAAQTISANVDTAQGTIGDNIKYDVAVVLELNEEMKDPFISQGMLGDFQIRDFKHRIERDVKQTYKLEYILNIFKTGKHEIPEYKIEYRSPNEEQWQVLSAKPIEITIQSILEKDKEQTLKPLKPKIIIWRDLWPGVILLAVLAVIAWWVYVFLAAKQKQSTEKIAVEPAHVIAYRELEQLRGANLIAQGLMEEYYQRLSGCLRRYLENRFFLRAPLMSTEEFLQEARGSTLLSSAQRIALKDFLVLSDLVKFAKYDSSGVEAENAFEKAKSFIDQTKQEVNQEEILQT